MHYYKKNKTKTSPSKDQKIEPETSSSPTCSTAEPNWEEETTDLSQAFASDEAVKPVPAVSTLAPASSTPSSASLLSLKEMRARIERNCQEPLRGKESLQSCKWNTKVPRLSILSSSSWKPQHMHPFSSESVLNFHGIRYAFCPSCAKIPAFVEAPIAWIWPTRKRAFISWNVSYSTKKHGSQRSFSCKLTLVFVFFFILVCLFVV